MKYTLATVAHDAPLRRMAREQAMPGWIHLAFARDPDWTASQKVLGFLSQTMVALDDADTVVGCGIRAIRKVYVNGRSVDIGYLCGLRSLPRIRGSLALAHAYRYFHQLHEADRLVPAYLTTIVEDNTVAIKLLTSRRASLPAYLDRGRFITSAFQLGRRPVASPQMKGVKICRGADVPQDAILDFLREEGPKHQFFPVLDRAGLGTPQWRDLNLSAFRIVLRDGTIIGVSAVWDQSAFRQTVVSGYPRMLGLVRPLLNPVLRLAGRRPLPPPGQCLKMFHAAFTCIRNDDPLVFAVLLERMLAEYRHSPYDYFVVGLHERNPLRAALRRFPIYEYASRLYLVCWEDGHPFCDALDPHLIPHLETAML